MGMKFLDLFSKFSQRENPVRCELKYVLEEVICLIEILLDIYCAKVVRKTGSHARVKVVLINRVWDTRTFDPKKIDIIYISWQAYE